MTVTGLGVSNDTTGVPFGTPTAQNYALEAFGADGEKAAGGGKCPT